MKKPRIIIPKHTKRQREIEEKMKAGWIPLRIKCPECGKIYQVMIEDLRQGLYTLLGEKCPHCKRHIQEKDDPEDLLVDLEEIKKVMKDKKGG